MGFCTPGGWGREKGNYSMCIADNPKGPWERVIFPEYMYDPGLFFDEDGKVYVAHGQGTIYLTELAADARSVKGKPVKIWSGGFKNAHELGGGFGMEGSHMYRINSKYYITCPAGGTEGWQICLRSDSIYGPYEHKLIMHDSSSYPPNGLHQGGMVQLKNGDFDCIAVAKGNGEAIIANNPDIAMSGFKFVVDEKYTGNVVLLQKGNDALTETVNAALASSKDQWNTWYEEAKAISGIEVSYDDNGNVAN